jgi:phospholipid-binding lipoprotein MlaA
MRKFNKNIIAAFCIATTMTLSGCATRPHESDIEALAEYKAINDPLEPTNRAIFAFNNFLDRIILEPIAKGYRYITPKPVRTGISNFLKNLSSPIIFANDLLQGEPRRSGTTVARFAVNTTVGILGIFDVASNMGLPYHNEDFGQTLAVWGIGEGPYLMVPLLGPSNPRDLTGKIADIFLDPANYAIAESDDDTLNYIATGRAVMSAITSREQLLDTLTELRKSSVDYYATIRTLYRQTRNNEIDNGLSTLMSDNKDNMNDFDFYDEETDFDFPSDETATNNMEE